MKDTRFKFRIFIPEHDAVGSHVSAQFVYFQFYNVHYTGYVWYKADNGAMYNQCLGCDEVHEHPDVEQFTGLYDKNGTEIYEGDIIRSYDENAYEASLNSKYIVKFGKYDVDTPDEFFMGLGFYCQHTLYEFKQHPLRWLGDIQILGNTHEDGHLLEGKE